jgi:hypothetical protein
VSEQYRMLGLTREEADFLEARGFEVVVVPGAEGRLALYWSGRDSNFADEGERRARKALEQRQSS